MTLRKLIFWPHLVAGLIAGAVIGIMSFTGVALAFETEILAWAERDVRRVTPPGGDPPRLPVADLLRRANVAAPEFRPESIILSADPAVAPLVRINSSVAFYVDPYTGAVHPVGAPRLRAFFAAMLSWHRYLAATGDGGHLGKALTGASNLAFVFLALSGLYLWWPRKWRTKGLRRSLVILPSATGKARDWNWHNVFGFWFAPVLLVLTLTAVPISYAWGARALYRVTGTPLPPSGVPSLINPPNALVPTPPPTALRRSPDEFIAAAQTNLPRWQTLALRLGPPRPGTPVVVTVREAGSWPRTAITTFQFDPFTAALLRRDGYADLNAAQQLRAWTRFLHTGQALGPWGQLLAGFASLVGCLLVYTGFALVWHRWQRWRRPSPPESSI